MCVLCMPDHLHITKQKKKGKEKKRKGKRIKKKEEKHADSVYKISKFVSFHSLLFIYVL